MWLLTDTGHLHVHQASAGITVWHFHMPLLVKYITAATTAFNMKLFLVWHLGQRSNFQRQTEDKRKTLQRTFVAESESRVLSCAVMLRTTRC